MTNAMTGHGGATGGHVRTDAVGVAPVHDRRDSTAVAVADPDFELIALVAAS